MNPLDTNWYSFYVWRTTLKLSASWSLILYLHIVHINLTFMLRVSLAAPLNRSTLFIHIILPSHVNLYLSLTTKENLNKFMRSFSLFATERHITHTKSADWLRSDKECSVFLFSHFFRPEEKTLILSFYCYNISRYLYYTFSSCNRLISRGIFRI